MNDIRAFIGHSFTPEDEAVVSAFTKYFDQVAGALTYFSWEHAERAEPEPVSAKVLRFFEGKNLFIAICTRKERAISGAKLTPAWLMRDILQAPIRDFEWKTSDWLIQEIGLAIARELKILILLEEGVRSPGTLQADIEYVQFKRDNPAQAFGKIMEMLSTFAPQATRAVGATSSEDAVSVSPEATKDRTIADHWFTPTPDWKRREYELAYMRAKYFKKDALQGIHDAYVASADAKEEGRFVGWEAFREWFQIAENEGGSLARLQQLAADNPHNPWVRSALGKTYDHFDDHEKSADSFKQAADLTHSDEDKLRFQGSVISQLLRLSRLQEARTLLASMHLVAFANEDLEKLYLQSLREFAREAKDADLEIAAMERLVELQPDDIDTRFQLAYRHSELTRNEDVALCHYLAIPYETRSAIAWNNLGVAFDGHSMPGKSVFAYKRSKDLGETLAMSNLANRLMKAGFVDEAQVELDEAVKIKGYSNNVNHSLTSIRELPDKEDEKLKQVEERARPTAEFYRQLGRAIARPNFGPAGISKWAAPDFQLTVGFKDGNMLATGIYQRHNSQLAFALGGLVPTSDTIKIKFAGAVTGHGVLGQVARTTDGEPVPSLLGGGHEHPKFIMIFSEDGKYAEVMEEVSTKLSRIFTLARVENTALLGSQQAASPASGAGEIEI